MTILRGGGQARVFESLWSNWTKVISRTAVTVCKKDYFQRPRIPHCGIYVVLWLEFQYHFEFEKGNTLTRERKNEGA